MIMLAFIASIPVLCLAALAYLAWDAPMVDENEQIITPQPDARDVRYARFEQ